MSTRCPEDEVSSSYAYSKHHCRCIVCVMANAERADAHRRSVGARIQVRKLPGTVFCPIMGKAAQTSYKQGCRCSVCIDTASVVAKAWRAARREKQRRLEGRPLTDEEILTRYGDMFEKFELAMKADVGYLIQMAEDASKAYEEESAKG